MRYLATFGQDRIDKTKQVGESTKYTKKTNCVIDQNITTIPIDFPVNTIVFGCGLISQAKLPN